MIEELPRETVLPVAGTGAGGFHQYGTTWWTDRRCPYAFKYLNLDALYQEQYFTGGGHPRPHEAANLFEYMRSSYRKLFGKDFASVTELGTGGGEFTQVFYKAGLDLLAVEGTEAGVAHMLAMGIPKDRIIKQNLKFLGPLPRRADLCVCTEVAEHVEPWFASKVVSNCVEASDVVWFSAAMGDAQPHWHHPNEVPIDAWDNIFAHFGHRFFVRLDRRFGRADRIYLSEQARKRVL